MDLTKYEKIEQYCGDKAAYFKRLNFNVLEQDFSEAASALRELINIINAVEAPVKQEKGNEQ